MAAYLSCMAFSSFTFNVVRTCAVLWDVSSDVVGADGGGVRIEEEHHIRD